MLEPYNCNNTCCNSINIQEKRFVMPKFPEYCTNANAITFGHNLVKTPGRPALIISI